MKISTNRPTVSCYSTAVLFLNLRVAELTNDVHLLITIIVTMIVIICIVIMMTIIIQIDVDLFTFLVLDRFALQIVHRVAFLHLRQVLSKLSFDCFDDQPVSL